MGDAQRPQARSSIPKGDVVLSNLPPYATQPWLSMGVALHYALLAQAGVRARVVRPLDPPFDVPASVAHASLVTFTFDPPMRERMAAMEAAYREEPAFFDRMVDELLGGGEEVIGLSLFRNNADVSLWVAKLLKDRRPSCRIVLGGPEAVEEPPALLLPWIDAVVGADAEAVIVPLFRALCDRKLELAAELRSVFVNDALVARQRPPGDREALPTPPLPVIDYAPLMPLLVGDKEATVPLLLNWGCPYHCAFCSNRGIYSRFTQGPVERVLDEMDGIASSWRALHDGSPPGLGLQLSDGTTNAVPAQFDELLRGVVERAPRWGHRPFLRGQTLFDARITEERVALMAEANFGNTFFGLDAASDGLRRSLSKPGNIAQVRAAMELYHRGGAGGLNFGVPVGMPGETEADVRGAEQFVDWALGLEGTIESITVLPYVFFLSAQDPALVRMNYGERRGVLWRADVPGGDPAERARRFMRLFDHIDGRVDVASPVPPYLALPAMLPDEPPARLEAFMERRGRAFDQMTPLQDRLLSVPRGARAQAPSPLWARAERVLAAFRPDAAWEHEGLAYRSPGSARDGLVAVFRKKQGGDRFAVLLEARDPGKRPAAHTRDFNVSYLKSWQGLVCGFDAALLGACVRELGRAEGD